MSPDQEANDQPGSSDSGAAGAGAGGKGPDWEKTFRDYREKFEETVSGQDERLLAALAYIPVVGWLAPYFFRKDSTLCRFHGLQSLILNVGIVAIYVLVWILNEGPIISYILKPIQFHYVTNFVMYISVWGFLIGSVMAALKAKNGELWEIPYFDVLREKLNIRQASGAGQE